VRSYRVGIPPNSNIVDSVQYGLSSTFFSSQLDSYQRVCICTRVFVYMCKRYVYNVHDNTRIGPRSSHKSRDIHDGTEKKQVH